MEAQGVKIKRFRADSASYQKDVIDLVAHKSQYFYIRAMRCADMEQQISRIPAQAWQKVRLGVQEMEVAEIKDYQPFGGEETYRLVISRIKRKDKQTDLFTGGCYTYRAIMTDDRQWENKQIVSFRSEEHTSELQSH